VLFVAFATLAGLAIGGAAGWILAWDPLGETARLSLVFGGGGAIAGAVVSLYARQRLAPAIGGRLSRLLTVAVGVPTLLLAVYLARFVAVFAAGAVPIWPFLLTLVILVAGAALGAVVVLAPIALLLSAVVGRNRPLPPRWRRRVAAEWFGSAMVLAFMGYMPEDGYRSLWFMLQEPRRSPWYEARQHLFSDVLSGSRCDVLVVPAEAGARSVDRTARDAITYMLAAQVADRTGLCVVDPDLARRALGEHLRRFDDAAVAALADRVGAKWMLRTEATITRDGQAFSLALRPAARNPDGGWAPAGQVTWPRLTWSDHVPPEIAAWRELPAAIAKLPIPSRSAAPGAGSNGRRKLPSDPAELAADTGDARDRAAGLQVLAAYAPHYLPEARTLWLRSLVALRHAETTDPEVQTLAARAWLGLGRRGYAERIVSPVQAPEGRLVLALTQGDLTGALEIADSVTSPWAALTDRVGIERLRWLYDQEAGANERRGAVEGTLPVYKALVHHGLGTQDWGHAEAAHLAAGELARLGVADKWVAARTHLLHVLSRVRWFAWIHRLRPDQAGTTEMLYAPAWRSHAADWRSEPIDRASRRDLVEVLFAINRASAFDDLETRLNRQALPDAALEEAAALAPALRRHPAIVAQATLAAFRSGGSDATWFDRLLQSAAREIAQRQLAFEDAYSAIGEHLEMGYGISANWRDEPASPWQLVTRARQLAARSETRAEASRLYARAADASPVRFDYLRYGTDLLAEEDRDRLRAELLAGLGARFRGNPARIALENAMVDGWDDPARELAFLMQQIDAGATDWRTSVRAATVLLRQQQPHDARRVLEQWLARNEGRENPVMLSNHAGEAASLFWGIGEVALGKVFAEASASRQTGAWRAIRAERLLATLDHEWKSAAQIERSLHERYEDFTALAIGTWYDVIAGNTDVDADLRTILQRDRTAWSGRIKTATWRRAGGDAAATRQAIESFRFPVTENQTQEWLRAWLAIEALLVDRIPTADDLDLIRKVAGASQQVHASIARGYAALRSGDHDTAVRLLRPLYPSSRSPDAMSEVWNYALPPLVQALVKAGQVDEARRLLEDRRHLGWLDAYYYQGKALVAHAEGRPDAAVQALWEALVKLPSFGAIPMPPPYQLLETVETLYLQSQDKRYLVLLRDLATRSSRTWPTSWAHAFIALYAEEPSVRAEAAAVALRLDPRSARLAKVPEEILDDAKVRLRERNPLMGTER